MLVTLNPVMEQAKAKVIDPICRRIFTPAFRRSRFLLT